MRVDLLPTTFEGKLTKVIQESAEVIMAITKLQDFGEVATDSVTGITYNNVYDLLSEINDLEHALGRIKKHYKDRGLSVNVAYPPEGYQDSV